MSTVIATLFLILILFSVLAFIYISLNKMSQTIQTVNTALERKAAANQLKTSILKVTMNTSGIIVTLENTGTRTILLSYYYTRDLDTNQMTSGPINATVEPGETRSILVPGSYNPAHRYTISLIDAKGGIIKTTYPYTKQPTGGNYTTNTTVKHIPVILDGYTVAVKGYNTTILETNNTPQVITGNQSSSLPLNLTSKPLTSQIFPDYSDWKYYKKIVIQENTGYDLTNYTVPIVLNSTNFDFTKAKPDGSDIRFITPESNLLDYWIQYWNQTAEKALVWVKLNLTGGGNTTIYLLYGNPNASYDTTHYGLTRVMINLTTGVSDGSNYKIIYEEWNMTKSLFNPSSGTLEKILYGNDNYRLKINYFPYYSEVFENKYIYICSNGFIVFKNNIANELKQENSTNELLENYKIISPFWTNLTDINGTVLAKDNQGNLYQVYITSYKNSRIFVDKNYADIFGKGVLIRWSLSDKVEYAIYQYIIYPYIKIYIDNYTYVAKSNYSSVLYNNGLIRFDFGENSENQSILPSYNDDTPVIGISFGDNQHYTVVNGSNEFNLTRWNNRPSVMFWPRKNATVPPKVYIYPSDRNGFLNEQLYGLSIEFVWDVSPAFAYKTIMNLSITGSSGGWYNFTVGFVWNGSLKVTNNSNLTPGTYKNLESSIERFYNSDPVIILLNVTSNVSFSILFKNVSLVFGHPNDPIIGVVSNSTDNLWIYRVRDGLWFNYTIPGGQGGYTSIAYDEDYGRFVLVNGTHLMVFYPENQSFPTTSVTGLQDSMGDGGFIISLNGYSVYAPGGGSSSYYVYNALGKLVSSGNFTEPVKPYTCTAVDYDNNASYVYFGSTGDIYRVTLDTHGSLSSGKISVDPAPPTGYPVGLDYYGGKLWVISRGGGISVIDLSTSSVSSLSTQLPYYPMTEGDRLVYVDGYLYHVREDGTSELWVFPAG